MTVHEIAINRATTLDALRDALPDFAKDIRLNLGSVIKEDPNAGLTLAQVHGIALASAYATRNAQVIQAIEGETASSLSAEEINAAISAWQQGAISFTEMRTSIRKSGLASQNDDEAMKAIRDEKMENIKLFGDPANPDNPAAFGGNGNNSTEEEETDEDEEV